MTRIEDNEGNVVAEFTPRTNEVYSEETAYHMIDMMKAVIDQGTGRRLRSVYEMKGPIAGKTGTTNKNSDGWFVGCVPQLVTAVWVGGDERDIHFNSTAIGQGSASALPVWALYMRRVYADKSLGYDPVRDFDKPESVSKGTHHSGGGHGEDASGGMERMNSLLLPQRQLNLPKNRKANHKEKSTLNKRSELFANVISSSYDTYK